MSKESFKSFVRTKPELINYVNNRQMTWQEFYNLFELYGPSHNIWNEYNTTTNVNNTNSSFSFKDMFSVFKGISAKDLQSGITSLQKGVGYLQELVKDNKTDLSRKSSYEPRPLYRRFDD